MDPDLTDLSIADLVESTAGRDKGKYFYVLEADASWLMLVNGKDRTIDKPKRKKRKHTQKVLHTETRIANKLRAGEPVLDSEIRRDLAYWKRELQSKALGG